MSTGTVDWGKVTLAPEVTESVQPTRRKQASDIPQAIRDLVDRLVKSPGVILKTTFPSEAHAKQAKTLVNQYARLAGIDPAPRFYAQPDKVTAHVVVPKASTPEAPAPASAPAASAKK